MLKQMKFYNPIKTNYLYLMSASASIVGDGANNFKLSWVIPSIDVKKSKIKIKDIEANNANAGSKYIIRLISPRANNFYDTNNNDPILYVSIGLNDQIFDSGTSLEISNTVINEISIRIGAGSTINDRDNGIANNISFNILLEIEQYEEENISYSYEVNHKQNFNNRHII